MTAFHLEEGPCGIHLLEQVQLALLDGLFKCLTNAQPHGKVQACLGPSKDPRDGAEGLNAAGGLALGRAAANVEATELAEEKGSGRSFRGMIGRVTQEFREEGDGRDE